MVIFTFFSFKRAVLNICIRYDIHKCTNKKSVYMQKMHLPFHTPQNSNYPEQNDEKASAIFPKTS